MHRGYQSLLAFAAIVLGFASGPAWAADFTFTVPVEVANLPPDSTAVLVDCHLYTSADARPGGRGHVGSSYGRSTISGGAYRGEVTTAGNANPGVDPATVTHYSCSLGIVAPLRGLSHTFSYGYASTPSTLPLAPGAPFNPQAVGTIR